MVSQHRWPLLHNNVRWLLRGKIFTCVHELQSSYHIFLSNKQFRFCNFLQCEFLIAKLQYLAPIFQHLNFLNSSFQEKEENILTCTDKMKVFKRKIQIWKRTAMQGSLEMFLWVSNNCKIKIQLTLVKHLLILEEKSS